MPTQAVYLESKTLAEDLYALLQTLDPSTWRDELEEKARELVARIELKLKRIIAAAERLEADPTLSGLLQRIKELAGLVRDRTPHPGLPVKDIRKEWKAFWRSAQPMYEGLASSLTLQDIHLPKLRPSNYARNVFHVSGGLFALVMIQFFLTPTTMIWLASAFAIFAWTCETFRRYSPGVNKVLMWVFGPMAHPHEHYRVNSATWYSTALLIIAFMSPPLACSLAVIVLAFADPAAAIFGRKFGRIRLRTGRSLEGSTAFVLVGVTVSLITMAIFYPEIALGTAILLALASSVPAALVELLSKRIDDNLTIPVTAAAGATVMLMLLGI